MNNYANAFYVARNRDRDEVVINLRQEFPVFGKNDPSNITTEESEIANIIVRGNVAKALATAIREIMEENDSNE